MKDNKHRPNNQIVFGWIIVGVNGAYEDWKLTKREMIRHHCQSLGINWTQARYKGDRAVKCSIRYHI